MIRMSAIVTIALSFTCNPPTTWNELVDRHENVESAQSAAQEIFDDLDEAAIPYEEELEGTEFEFYMEQASQHLADAEVQITILEQNAIEGLEAAQRGDEDDETYHFNLAVNALCQAEGELNGASAAMAEALTILESVQ